MHYHKYCETCETVYCATCCDNECPKCAGMDEYNPEEDRECLVAAKALPIFVETKFPKRS